MSTQSVVRMLFGGLVRLDENLIPQLELAESCAVSPDFKTYTFTLKDCLWSDGSPITAYDFEESWKQGLTPAYSCANTNLFFFIKNGKKAFSDPTYLHQLGVIALNDKILKVELEESNPHFLNVLINSVFSPVHKSMRTSSPDPKNMICSGPFYLKEYIFQDQVTLQCNKNYWNCSEVKLDEIWYYIVNDEATALLMFEKGQIDILGTPMTGVSADATPSLKKTGRLKFLYGAGSQWLFVNTRKYPLNNRNIRLALAYAIDREQIQKNILHLDENRPSLGIIPKILKKERWHPWFQDHDTTQAQIMFEKGLQELGITVDQFPKIRVSFPMKRLIQTTLLAIQRMWKNTLGVEISLEGVEGPILMNQFGSGNFEIGCLGWVTQYNDPSCLLELFKYQNAPNFTGWENPDFIFHANAFLANSEDEKRWESAEAAEEIFSREMPSIPLSDSITPYLIQPHVKNLAPNPLFHIDFDRAIVD
jgi:oligopeptide transport system substrate-binding protein